MRDTERVAPARTLPGMAIADAPTALESGLRRIDEMADRTFSGWKVPGLSYGIVLGDRLIHHRGLGTLRVGEASTPKSDSVFRIASMTKSFTAATVLSLRDDGLLRLDDPIARYVPELATLRYPTTDSPEITIRHLLTMTAGFPTDDPWGDRQQGLDLEAFRQLLARGLSFAWVPGTRFEYSNTGYGILGRLITNVAGREYREVVRERLTRPLGMDATGYLESEVPEDRKAMGYVWRNGEYIAEGMDPYGALAAMGGIFTSVEDLATWVSGFLDATPRDGADIDHPLKRATRREMQQGMVPVSLRATQASADAVSEIEAGGYGFGLFTIDDGRIGRVVSHSGGYPGFGSNMRWHAASGLGVIALTNHRYGAAALLARDILNELVRSESAPIRRVRPNAATEAARGAAEALISEWDDRRARDLFAMNVELDEPIADRKRFIEGLRERHGALRRDESEPVESVTSYHASWWLAGERGRVKLEILLSPELPPKVQTFSVTSVPEPGARLTAAAEAIVGAMQPPSSGSPVAIDWPASLAVGADVDLGAVVRSLRATEARFSPVALGPAIAGDGETKATWRLLSSRGRVDLSLELDPDTDCLTSVALVPAKQLPPDLA
jgi:CubicO group peptidase (beta-lactamase class C family)